MLHEAEFIQAIQYFEKSASEDYPPSFLLLYRLYLGRMGSKQRDPVKSELYRKKACDEFSFYEADVNNQTPQSHYLLACCYDFGVGTAKNPTAAVQHYRAAAEQGYTHAQISLGTAYSNGEGVQQDDKQAIRWYQLAADQGDPRANWTLGAHYLDRPGASPKDEKAAFRFVKSSSDNPTSPSLPSNPPIFLFLVDFLIQFAFFFLIFFPLIDVLKLQQKKDMQMDKEI